MARPHLLAVDQGTTNTKAVVIDDTGRTIARASQPVETVFPQAGWVEQDAGMLWTTVRQAIDQCLARAGNPAITAVGITNQRESVLAWDRNTGQPLGPCIVWQCRRTAPFCADLRARGLESTIRAKTGLTIDPLFSASKARWLLEHLTDGRRRAASGDLCIGTVDSWVLWNITGGAVHATDASNAARTQLFNLQTGAWDPELLEIFGIPAEALPQVGPSSHIYGYTVGSGHLSDGVPIASLIGDSHAALFGQSAGAAGAVKATYGTGSSLMTLIDRPLASHAGLSTTVAWALPNRTLYALEGNITVTGGAVEWLGHLLGLPLPAQGIADLAASAADSGGVYVVPAFAGLGAPHWDDGARGLVCGLTGATTAAHLARATIESIAYQVRDVFEAMQSDLELPVTELLADGGASTNDALVQFQADILGCPVRRNRSADLSALGAAWLAGLAVGVWRTREDLERLPHATDRFEPAMDEAERARLHGGWVDAVARARSHQRDSVVRRPGSGS